MKIEQYKRIRKLEKIKGYSDNQVYLELKQFCQKWFEGLEEYSSDELKKDYPESRFYGKNKEIYIQERLDFNENWLDYNKIWKFFETKYNYNYQEIKELTKGLLEIHTNLRVLTTGLRFLLKTEGLEIHTNLRVLTTHLPPLMVLTN